MKVYSLFFLLMFFYGCFVMSMELTLLMPSLISWYKLPETVIMHIVAISSPSDKQSLYLVNKQLSCLASKKNIDNLLRWPCVLSKNYHLNLMIEYAKIKNEKLMILAIKSAPWCDHDDAVEIISYFLTKDDDLSTSYLSLYKNDRRDQYLQVLLPTVMAVYRADQGLYDVYKKNFIVKSKLCSYSSVLQTAVFDNHSSLVKLFLAQEKNGIIDCGIKEGMDYTPLHIAASKNNSDMVKLLLTHDKTMINAVTRNNATPLCVAIGSMHYDLAIALLNAGADTNILTTQGEKGGGFLHFAVINGKCDLIVRLLYNGIAVDKQNEQGDTALMTSVSCDNTFISVARLQKNTAKEISTYGGLFFSITQLLLSGGANPNIGNVFGETPLKNAACVQNVPMIKLLLQYGALPYVKNLNGENVYCQELDDEIGRLLKKSKKTERPKKSENCIIS